MWSREAVGVDVKSLFHCPRKDYSLTGTTTMRTLLCYFRHLAQCKPRYVFLYCQLLLQFAIVAHGLLEEVRSSIETNLIGFWYWHNMNCAVHDLIE